ncbi:MAG: hypothetical protein WCK27_13045 [Verrucomicrobiota bacterium]
MSIAIERAAIDRAVGAGFSVAVRDLVAMARFGMVVSAEADDPANRIIQVSLLLG